MVVDLFRPLSNQAKNAVIAPSSLLLFITSYTPHPVGPWDLGCAQRTSIPTIHTCSEDPPRAEITIRFTVQDLKSLVSVGSMWIFTVYPPFKKTSHIVLGMQGFG